jgi:hypothetical protein
VTQFGLAGRSAHVSQRDRYRQGVAHNPSAACRYIGTPDVEVCLRISIPPRGHHHFMRGTISMQKATGTAFTREIVKSAE